MPPFRLSTATLAWASLLTAWFALDFVGVPRLVDREGAFTLAGLMLAILLVVLWGGWRGWRWLAPVYLAALVIWAGLQIETHWLGYAFNEPSAQRLAWYERAFGEHLAILPDRPGHTRPDAYHTVLAGLLLVNLVSTGRDSLRPGPLRGIPPAAPREHR